MFQDIIETNQSMNVFRSPECLAVVCTLSIVNVRTNVHTNVLIDPMFILF